MSDYEETVESFTSRLTKLITLSNKETGYVMGSIGLIVRDSSIGNIDVIHNCKTNEDITEILKLTIKQLEKRESHDVQKNS